MQIRNRYDLKFTSHRIETNTSAPLTVHEMTAGGRTRWLVDHRAHALRSERNEAAWDPARTDWADITTLEARKAFYQTIDKAYAENGKDMFGKEEAARKLNYAFEDVKTEARGGFLKMKHIPEAASTDDKKVCFSDPDELSEFLRSTYETPRAASRALSTGSLRGKETYKFAPADLQDFTPKWTVKSEHTMTPHLAQLYNIQQVGREPNENYKPTPSEKPTLSHPANMRIALQMLETGGDIPGRNTTLSLGSQVIASNYIAEPTGQNAFGLPEPFERRAKRDKRMEEFRQADGRRNLIALATDKETTSLGRFAEARETAASLLDPRSPQGREWTAWAASSRWAVNCKHNDKVVGTQRDRMVQMAADYPDADLGRAITDVALSIETTTPYKSKRRDASRE